MWEDPKNHDGGRWLINLDKKQRNSELDSYWLEVVSCTSQTKLRTICLMESAVIAVSCIQAKKTNHIISIKKII